jgi:hypothetical protein
MMMRLAAAAAAAEEQDYLPTMMLQLLPQLAIPT